MKTLRALLLGSVVFGSLASRAGEMTSGGGDVYALEFTALAYEVAGYLETLDQKQNIRVQGLDPRELLAAIQVTRVVTADALVLNEQPVDAINTPELKLIRIDRGRWRDSAGDAPHRMGLVFHEFMGILRKDDSHYALSQELLGLLSRYGFASSREIECLSYQRRLFSPDALDDGRFKVRISNRGVFQALAHFELSERQVNATTLMDRFTREVPPGVYEALSYKDRTGSFRLDLRLDIPDGQESFESTAVLSDGSGGQRLYLTFDLRCKVLE